MNTAYITNLLRAISVLESHINIGENYEALIKIIEDFPDLELISIFGEASDADIGDAKDAMSDAYNALIDAVNNKYDFNYIQSCITSLKNLLNSYIS